MRNILLSTDGSKASKLAFYQGVEFFEYKNIFNKFIVAHVSDPNKDYLPFEFQSSTIENDYKIELISRYPAANFDLIFQVKDEEEENIKNQIIQISKLYEASYLIVGFHGRKGEKQDVTILGQTVRNSVYNSSIPILVVKKLYRRDDTNGFRFLVCVDGSKKSYKSLDAAIELTFDERDSILICFAPTPDSEAFGAKIKSKVVEYMKGFQRKWAYKQLDVSYENIGEIIGLINNSNDLDFVVFGTNGYRAQLEMKEFFGNTADKLLKSAKANVLIVP